jgi:hypothetical protein
LTYLRKKWKIEGLLIGENTMNKLFTSALAITAGLAFSSAYAAPVSGTKFKQINVRPFSNISVTGGVNVVLKYRADHRPSVQEAGKGIKNVRVSVKKGTLSIHAPSGEGRKQLPQVLVSLNQPIQSLSVQDIADVSGSDLHAQQLNIWAKGPGRISLSGNLSTSQIWQSGGGYVTLKGVHGKDLSIKLSEMATTRLQGKAHL